MDVAATNCLRSAAHQRARTHKHIAISFCIPNALRTASAVLCRSASSASATNWSTRSNVSCDTFPCSTEPTDHKRHALSLTHRARTYREAAEQDFIAGGVDEPSIERPQHHARVSGLQYIRDVLSHRTSDSSALHIAQSQPLTTHHSSHVRACGRAQPPPRDCTRVWPLFSKAHSTQIEAAETITHR
jgi:hypothetical protein